jgi:hypothetical protein
MLPADVMGQMAEEIDEEVVRTVQRIAGASAETDWGKDPIMKLWMTQGKGLPGIRKLGKTAEAAAIASFLAAARNIPGLKIPGSVMHSIMVYNQRVRANKIQMPESTSELLKATETWRRPQKKLTQQIADEEARELRSLLDVEDKIKMDAMQEKKAGTWLKNIDYGTIFEPGAARRRTFSDDEARYLIRRGMPGPDPHGTGLLVLTCLWCKKNYDTRMTHVETCCTHIRGGEHHNAFQEGVIDVVHELGGFARASGLSMAVPPACAAAVVPCLGCDECDKQESVRVDVDFGGLAAGEHFSVDVANKEILRQGAKCTKIPGTDRYNVAAPVAREEEVKRKRYEQLCREQRGRTFIPVVMSSYGAPGAGMRKMVAIMSERLQRIDGGTAAETKRRILRCLQAKAMREIARNGLEALKDQRILIMKERERRERMRNQAKGRSNEEAAQAFLTEIRI